jgi:uncharacterized protein YbjT (DUF2867 family)
LTYKSISMSHFPVVRRHWGMKIAIAGGTGTLGRHVGEELTARGHDVRVLSRGARGGVPPEEQSRSARPYAVDLTTGAGLDEAIAGCEVVVDASNNSSKNAAATLVGGTRRLLAAGREAGVAHHVCVSIVGCELVPIGYFRVKAEQEGIVGRGTVPWTIVRATQFHEYLAAMFGAGARWRAVPLPRTPLQPVAVAEVARVVADAVEQGPRNGRVEIAGPEVAGAVNLARAWRRATGTRAVLVPLPLPGRLGRALGGGALTTENADVRGRVTFAAWLESTARS